MVHSRDLQRLVGGGSLNDLLRGLFFRAALVAGIKVAQGELADLNLMSEHLDHHVEVQEVSQERDDLKHKNDLDQARIDELFAARRNIEADTVQVEADVERVKAEKEQIVQQLNGEQLEAYRSMRSEIDAMGDSIRTKQQQLDG